MRRTLENTPQAQAILKHAVRPETLQADGHLTAPRSWGVYAIEPPPGHTSSLLYRIGNHPVRQRELEAEFGSTRRVALFLSRQQAVDLQRVLNAS